MRLLLLIILFTAAVSGQDSTGSLAFRKNRPVKKSTLFYQPDLSYPIWQQFNLIKEANAGNPLAQHELGLRYLSGEELPADTVKAAEWIRKAALQKLTAAAFNYGILLYNGWGTEWNPFEAFRYFMIAAKDGMAQAEYIVGILYTDNLIVRRDLGKAYSYLRRASAQGHSAAADVLEEVRKRLPRDLDTTKKELSYKPPEEGDSQGLVFIDFERPVSRGSNDVSDSLLFEDLLLTESTEFDSIVLLKDSKPVISFTKDDIGILSKTSSWGCPEALALTGRLHEKGIFFPQDAAAAAAYYVRASRLDSYRATVMLYNLIRDANIIKEIKDAALNGNPGAMFVWYGLFDFNLDNSIDEKEAFDLLKKSAEKGYLPAVVELGLNYYTGKYVGRDINTAVGLWNSAASGGSSESLVRIAASVVYGETETIGLPAALDILQKGSIYGSVLAQVAVAYAYENGMLRSGRHKEIKLYRIAAQRGNRYAYNQLKRKYNEIRPPNPEFILE